MSAITVPCRICGCIDGEPSFCHCCLPAYARRNGTVTCHRIIEPDICTACWEWIPQPGAENHGDPLIDALRAELRASRADWTANLRGSLVPGAKRLRWHAIWMRAKARRWRREAAVPVTAMSRSTPSENPTPEAALAQ